MLQVIMGMVNRFYQHSAATTTQTSTAQASEPPKQQLVWKVLGSTLEKLSGKTCAQSSVYQIRRTEHSFQLKVCPSSTVGSLGNLHFFVAKRNKETKLYWPFPYSLALSVVVKKGNKKVHHLRSGH